METVSASWLQSIDALKEVPLDQLQWMIDNSEIISNPEGSFTLRPGEPLPGTYVVLEGVIKLSVRINGEMREINRLEQKAISGYLPFSRGHAATVTGEVIADVKMLLLPVSRIREMISKHFELTQALVHIMTNRVRDTTALQQQNEKMVALGKLSAGLAHELNNPAAAIVRGSDSLKEHLRLVPETFKAITALRLDEKEVDQITNMVFNILTKKERPRMTLMERTEREDELRDWLDDHQVENSGDISETLMEYSITCDDLRFLKNLVPGKPLSAIFNWINSNLVTERMVSDIQEASERISDLVKSVKLFTHMDQGKGKEYVDVHVGIRNTLTILQYKIKKGNIEVVEQFDESLPKVKAMVGELNQVWTNLIDNAIDAMAVNGKGKLIIHTEKEREFIKVTIIDNGPGIPDDVKSFIFDPFFTTKDIGKGTGLGLDMVQRIIAQHRGSVKVNSRPGHTEFITCFLIDG